MLIREIIMRIMAIMACLNVEFVIVAGTKYTSPVAGQTFWAPFNIQSMAITILHFNSNAVSQPSASNNPIWRLR